MGWREERLRLDGKRKAHRQTVQQTTGWNQTVTTRAAFSLSCTKASTVTTLAAGLWGDMRELLSDRHFSVEIKWLCWGDAACWTEILQVVHMEVKWDCFCYDAFHRLHYAPAAPVTERVFFTCLIDADRRWLHPRAAVGCCENEPCSCSACWTGCSAAPRTATMTRLRRKALVALFLFTLFIFGAMMGLRTLKPSDGFSDLAPGMDFIGERTDRRRLDVKDVVASPGQFHMGGSDTKVVFTKSDRDYSIFYDVHIFYYLWYGSPSMDNKYIHWDHVLVPHWDPKIAASHAQGKHAPPDDIASSFYPELGSYSSRDPKVLESHMSQIEAAAAGTGCNTGSTVSRGYCSVFTILQGRSPKGPHPTLDMKKLLNLYMLELFGFWMYSFNLLDTIYSVMTLLNLF